jgi:hypothetical protein
MAIALDRPSVAMVEDVLARDRTGAPAAEVVTRELGAESWTLRLGLDGRLRGITVLATSRAAPRRPPAFDGAATMPPLDRRFGLPPDGALTRILGEAFATGRQLADLALRRDDPEVRAEAVRVGVDAMLQDPSLEQAVLAALDGVDAAALAQAVASIAGDASAALVSVVATRASGRPLGRRAAHVLERLGGGG